MSFEPGGARLAVQKIGLEFHNWKRYKGGEAEDIWVGTLSPLAFGEVTKYDGKDAFPMWAPDGRIYFATDRWGRPNLASMLPDGSDVRRLTRFDDYDVRWPSMGDGRIVYQHKMDLWSYDLASGRNEPVKVELPSDRLQVREKFVDPNANLRWWDLSKDGARIVLETRGDVFVARTRKKGLIRRITASSLSRTRFPPSRRTGRRSPPGPRWAARSNSCSTPPTTAPPRRPWARSRRAGTSRLPGRPTARRSRGGTRSTRSTSPTWPRG